MELVKGQNIAIANTNSLVIDIGWRSGATDLHLQAYGIFYPSNNEQGQLIDAQQAHPHIIRSADGRRFELDMAQLDQKMDKFAIALILPNNTKYRFDKVQNLQAFINSGEGDKIATIKLEQQFDDALAMHFIEIYQHRDQWKLKLLALPLSGDVISLAKILNYPLPTHLQPNETVVDIDVTKEPKPKAHSLRDGISLNMGQSFSLSQQYAHVLQLTYKARCAPALDDITLNALALNSDDKVRNIKDFIYHSNSSLKGGALTLDTSSKRECTINIDFQKLAADITKICLIATRESDSKRFSSADFIQCKLESTNTSVPICDFTCETAKKNYNCIILLEIYKYKDEWKVKAIGQGYAQGLDAIGEKYGFNAPRIRPMQSSSTSNNTVASSTATTSSSTHNSHNLFGGPAVTNSSAALTQSSAPNQQIANSTGVGGMILAVAGLCIMLSNLSSAQLFSQPVMLVLSILAMAAGSYITINARKQAKLKLVEATERFMLNLIKQNNYHITPFEVAARSTLTVQQATTILDVLCDKGAGRLTMSDNGSEVYLFETMQSQQNNSTLQDDTW
ncbi:TerD family protein [Gammaproteobacteria bacterium AS21]